MPLRCPYDLVVTRLAAGIARGAGRADRPALNPKPQAQAAKDHDPDAPQLPALSLPVGAGQSARWGTERRAETAMIALA
jgi:hypothetical protein